MDQPTDVPLHLLECYWPDITPTRFHGAVQRAASAVEGWAARGHDLQLVGSVFVPADETVFWLIRGEDPGAMRQVIPGACERVVPCEWLAATTPVASRTLDTPTST